jgi:serine/threonine protein kinase
VGEHEGKAFITMEYVEGQSLRDIIDSNFTKLQKFSKVLDYASQRRTKLTERGSTLGTLDYMLPEHFVDNVEFLLFLSKVLSIFTQSFE